jgi:hypothetical protein
MRIAIYSHSIAPSIDGVCRRFTGILWELSRQNHDVLLFTLEQAPEDLPSSLKWITLDHMIMPSYPGKKVARPNFNTLLKMCAAIEDFKPTVITFVNNSLFYLIIVDFSLRCCM